MLGKPNGLLAVFAYRLHAFVAQDVFLFIGFYVEGIGFQGVYQQIMLTHNHHFRHLPFGIFVEVYDVFELVFHKLVGINGLSHEVYHLLFLRCLRATFNLSTVYTHDVVSLNIGHRTNQRFAHLVGQTRFFHCIGRICVNARFVFNG